MSKYESKKLLLMGSYLIQKMKLNIIYMLKNLKQISKGLSHLM